MSITRGILEEHMLHNVFIATGMGNEESAKVALSLGFSRIYIVESNRRSILRDKICFSRVREVHVSVRSVLDFLEELLPKIHQPTVFWLDTPEARDCSDLLAGLILEELDIISRHCIKEHVVLVSNMSAFARKEGFYGIRTYDIERALLDINPEYKLCFVDGVVPSDVLVASL